MENNQQMGPGCVYKNRDHFGGPAQIPCAALLLKSLLRCLCNLAGMQIWLYSLTRGPVSNLQRLSPNPVSKYLLELQTVGLKSGWYRYPLASAKFAKFRRYHCLIVQVRGTSRAADWGRGPGGARRPGSAPVPSGPAEHQSAPVRQQMLHCWCVSGGGGRRAGVTRMCPGAGTEGDS